MSKMSHINVIEKYEQHSDAIHSMLSSILKCFSADNIFEKNETDLSLVFKSLTSYYPFISLLYLLDSDGRQVSMNVPGVHFKNTPKIGEGVDRSHKPYYLAAVNSEDVTITEPYLSNIKRELCLSTSLKIYNEVGEIVGFIVLDVDLTALLLFLTGDAQRAHFEPYFKVIYSLIVAGLALVSLVLIYMSMAECFKVVESLFKTPNNVRLPFGVVIYLTLALAIFDLARTTLEEEVLLYKDILRHSSTRRTITRFIAAIIIAVSIEALLMIFKSALHGGDHILDAVGVMISAAILLLALGVYVYFGSKAEVMLMNNK